MMNSILFVFLLSIIVCVFAWLISGFRLSDTPSMRKDRLVERIDALLPQTQCGKCDYAGCLPYARAIAENAADINHCPPGGDETIKLIAALLGRESKALTPGYSHQTQDRVAYIDEDLCIGCVLCINACPVDAIIGAAKQMHTVLDKSCTACELCIRPCPVDCISMQVVQAKIKRWIWTKPRMNFETQA